MFLRGFLLLLAALVPLALQAQVRPPDDECEVGAPRVCVRHVLQDEGHIRACIFGEDWSPTDTHTWTLLKTNPALKIDPDLGKRNRGITIVIL